MIHISSLLVHKKNLIGLKVELPDSPPLLLILAQKGFVMCGFLNIEAAEKLGVAAVRVSGVSCFEDLLQARINAMTLKARNLGVVVGITGADALEKLS
ncbi:MAG: DUF1805 domain-containing protein [Candidatus Bathyarchaeota archaeon]|jgi:uncharacterized protein YunC (DUF1805 family)